jgi:hypothetical protein
MIVQDPHYRISFQEFFQHSWINSVNNINNNQD